MTVEPENAEDPKLKNSETSVMEVTPSQVDNFRIANAPMAQMGKSEGGPQPEAPPSYFQATEGLPPAGPIPITPAGPVPGTHHANQAQQQGPTIVTTVGRHTAHMICPSCHAEVDSATEKKPGPTAYFCGTFIVLLGCWCGCCLIPCCIDDCMEVHHTCPNCKANLGKYRK